MWLVGVFRQMVCVNLVGLFKLAFECINRWFTGDRVSCALTAVRADAAVVCVSDSDNFLLIVRSFYSSFSKFECDSRVFQRQTLTSF